MVGLKRLLPRSLFGRSLMIVMLPVILVQIATAYFFFERHWDDVARRLTLVLAGDIALLIDSVRDNPPGERRDWLLDRARARIALDARFHAGELLPSGPRHAPSGPVDSVLARVLPERISYPFQFDSQIDDETILIAVQLPEGVLEVVAPRKRLFSTTIYVFLSWTTGISLLLLAVAIYFLGRQITPIRRLAHAADSFGKGIQVIDFKPQGATEVRQAANAFLRMRERILRQITQRTEMLAGVSHDLRTLLTRMKLQIAMMRDSEGLRDLKADIAEMEKMVEGYLAFARGEGGEAAVALDLAEVLDEVAGGARRKGAAVELSVDGALPMILRRQAIKRALTNLVENAARYGRHVWVDARKGSDAVEVTIDDDGPGIPAEQRESVFKPFFRLDASRNVQTGGIGLGLTIARDLVRNHGGEVVLDDAPSGGLRALVRLPI